MTIWFTADTHFGHKNIIKYSNRPFASIAEMDERLILNWNTVVQQSDDVYHLGDIFLSDLPRAKSILNRLNGRKYLIRGNHDKTAEKMADYFAWVRDYHRLKLQDDEAEGGSQAIVLMHYAMRVWNQSHRGAFHAYGHSHASLPDDPNARSMDVGVDSIAMKLGGGPENYRPVAYAEYKRWMLAKNWVPIDHHEG